MGSADIRDCERARALYAEFKPDHVHLARSTSDPELIEAIWSVLEGVARGWIKRWNIPYPLREDLLATARLAVLQAIQYWDPNRAKFCTYGTWYMRISMMHYLKAEWRWSSHRIAEHQWIPDRDEDGENELPTLLELQPLADTGHHLAPELSEFRVQRFLRQNLPAREAMVMEYLVGVNGPPLRPQLIANLLGVSPHVVYRLIKQARQRLKSRYHGPQDMLEMMDAQLGAS